MTAHIVRPGDGTLHIMVYIRDIVAISVFSVANMAWGQQSCESLASLKLPSITITSAVSVVAGSIALPGGRGNNTVQVPAFCRLAATIEKEVRIELWMPMTWNHKLVAVGNGGLAGSISYAAMVKPLSLGYAVSSTDTGHQASSTTDGEWALGHYDRIVNFADRATHLMAEADKVILNRYYAAQPVHAYFTGCSQGGHEAMIEAQRYPNDFDGIVAGDPANNWTHHYIGGHLWTALAVDGDGYLPPEKVQILADAVNAQCDALDGVKDGVLNDPRRCNFRPETLLVPGFGHFEVPDWRAGGGGGEDLVGTADARRTADLPGAGARRRSRHGRLGELHHGHWSGDGTACAAGSTVFPVLRVRRSVVEHTQLPFRREGRVRQRHRCNRHEARGAVQCGEPGSEPVPGPRRETDSLPRLERPRYYAAQQHQLLRERGRRRRAARRTV